MPISGAIRVPIHTIAAVNTGEVFRFHTKPCPTDVIRKTLHDALSRYRTESVILPAHSIAASSDATVASGEAPNGGKGAMPLLSVLTGKELRVADLIRMDASSKEIAHIMNISPRTVEAHRENIRKKLGLANAKINLQGFLKTIT